MFDYAQTAAEASEAIRDAGAPILLTQQSAGDYNTATSEVETAPRKCEGYGVLVEYEDRYIDGTNVRTGDVRILIAVHQRDGDMLKLSATFPAQKPGDLVTLAPGTSFAETYRVVRPKVVKPGMVPVLYEVQARK